MGNLAELLSTVEVFEKLADKDRQDLSKLATVSYTHLTLPTSDLV